MHGLCAWLRFRLKLLPNHRKYDACVICMFGMEKEEVLAKNSRHHRLKLILYSQVRVEVQRGIYNPNMQFR